MMMARKNQHHNLNGDIGNVKITFLVANLQMLYEKKNCGVVKKFQI